MKPMPRLILLALVLAPQTLFGWGRDGHQIVGYIAESRLTPAAKAGIDELIGKRDLASISNWADQIRRDRDETAPWHYVDIPYEFKSYDPQRDGKDGNNVIDKIEEFANVLNDRTATKEKRIEALRFLVHFVGDIHQPLHAAERNDDKGGNFCKVLFLDDPNVSNLHRIWDSTILNKMMAANDPDTKSKEYAEKLAAAITPKQAAQWFPSTPRQWAEESHQLAVSVAYAGIPTESEQPTRIEEQYVQKAAPVIDLQLQKAGVRLAGVLNRIFPEH